MSKWSYTPDGDLQHPDWEWKRNTKRFPYINLEGKLSHYTPDFYVEDLSSYIEVKGYETDLDRCKWSQFKYNITVWKKSKIKKIKGHLGELV